MQRHDGCPGASTSPSRRWRYRTAVQAALAVNAAVNAAGPGEVLPDVGETGKERALSAVPDRE